MSQPGIGSLNQAQVFQCQICREIINTSMTNCPYCGVEINRVRLFFDDGDIFCFQ